MATLGSLVVTLEANIAKFGSDLGKAVTMAEASMNKVAYAFETAKVAAEAMAAAFVLERVGAFALDIVEAAGHLKILSMETGLSVEALSALENEGAKAGLEIGGLTKAFDKMEKSAAAAVGGSKKSQDQFNLLKIGAHELAEGLKNPDSLLLLVSQRLEKFADDGNKTAFMMNTFGRGGAVMAAALHAIARDGLTAATVSTEMADKAHEFDAALAGVITNLKAFALKLVLDVMPAMDKILDALKWIGILGGGAFLWLVGLPRLIGLAAAAINVFIGAITAANVSLTAFSIASGNALLAFNVLTAGLAAFGIGSWLYAESDKVKLAGAMLIHEFNDFLIQIKYDFRIAFNWMDDVMTGWTLSIGKKLSGMPSVLGDLGKRMVKGVNDEAMKNPSSTASLQAARKAEMAQNDADMQAARDYYKPLAPLTNDRTPNDYWKVTKPKPSIGVAESLDHQKHINDGLIKEMDARLKIIDEAIKREDELTKLGNAMLDADYEHGLSDIASYSTAKIEMLRKNFAITQSLREAEIALAQSYVTRLEAARGKEKDKGRQGQLDSEIETARAKAAQLSEKKSIEAIKNDESLLALGKQTLTQQAALAKVLRDVDMAYAVLNGDTETAARVQFDLAHGSDIVTLNAQKEYKAIERLAAIKEREARVASQQGLNRQIYDIDQQYLKLIGHTEQAVEAQIAWENVLQKDNLPPQTIVQLTAIQNQMRLMESHNGWDGMTRAVQTYAKNIQNVAAQTEAMTTHMLTSLEDGIVEFVHTGKLNWKSMIDSMIVDLIRLAVQQQVMRFVAMAFGGVGSVAASGASGAVGGASMGAEYYRAAGGPVEKGTTYTVGERGPEQFVPSVQGSIVPNGGSAGGMPSITYAPTIQIDSRSDRAQVQKDTADLLRAGNKEMLGILLRYNPGLKV